MRFRTAAAALTASLSSLFLATGPASADPASGMLHAVQINTAIVEGAAPIDNAIDYRIHRRNGDGWQEISAYSGPSLRLELPAGDYQVEAVYGQSSVTSELRVQEGPLEETLALNAGEITLAVQPGMRAKRLREEIDWQILTYERNADGEREEITRIVGDNPFVVLPEGLYLVRAETRRGVIRHTVEVDAGRRYDYTLLQQ